MALDPKLDHAREFTDIEDETLDLWLQLENANLDTDAAQVLDAGLMHEHHNSLLDSDPTKRTPLENATQLNLLQHKLMVFSAARAKLIRRGRTRTVGRWVWDGFQWVWTESEEPI